MCGGLGLFQGRLGRRLFGHLGQVLGDLLLFLDQFLGLRRIGVVEIGLRGGLSHLLLLVGQLADRLLDGLLIGLVHQPAGPFDHLQQGP